MEKNYDKNGNYTIHLLYTRMRRSFGHQMNLHLLYTYYTIFNSESEEALNAPAPANLI